MKKNLRIIIFITTFVIICIISFFKNKSAIEFVENKALRNNLEVNSYGVPYFYFFELLGKINPGELPLKNQIRIIEYGYFGKHNEQLVKTGTNLILSKNFWGEYYDLILLENQIKLKNDISDVTTGSRKICFAICFWSDETIFVNFYAIPNKTSSSGEIEKEWIFFKNKQSEAYKIYSENNLEPVLEIKNLYEKS